MRIHNMSYPFLRSLLAWYFLLTLSLTAQETTFLLIRHGESEWNALQKIQGQIDIPLSTKGLQQSEQIADFLSENHPDIVSIHSSDLVRAAITAKNLADKLNLTFSQHPSLREIGRGDAEGLTYTGKKEVYDSLAKTLDEMYPNRTDRWKVSEVPGSETYEQASCRIRSTLEKIGSTNLEKKAAIITHGALIEVFLVDIGACETNLHLPNCSIVEISYCPTRKHEPFQLIQISSPLTIDRLKHPACLKNPESLVSSLLFPLTRSIPLKEYA